MSSASSIPLHCSICPKKPNFSDVSHLLTHIASKGHLSHYYKLKVRAASEESSRQLLEAFDRWYAEWNVEDLMSERMNLKEKRRSRAKSAGKAPGPAAAASTRHSQRSTRARGLDVLDPRLSEHHIKAEPSPTPPLAIDPAFVHRSFTPQMVPWHVGRLPTFGNPGGLGDGFSDSSDVQDRRSSGTADGKGAAYDGDDQSEEGLVSECTKLKGVYWPGMDIFDSATPEMRRKRNQKKDISVVEQLELNSLEVEPTELIFTPYGSLKKSRRISGSVDEDSSPIKPDLSPQSRLESRLALAELDVNRPRRRTRASKAVFPELTPQPPPPPPLFHNDQSDCRPAYAGGGNKRKRDFDVFRDQEVSFSRPANMTYLTSEFNPFKSADAAAFEYKGHADPFHADVGNHMEPLAYHASAGYDAPVYHTANYYAAGFQYPTYVAGPSHDASGLMANHLFLGGFYAPDPSNDLETDDGRTITATPSEM